MEIKNRQVLITGASRGIGRAVAKMCAQDQAHLHLVIRKPEATLVEDMKQLGAKSVTLWEADLSDKASIDHLIKGLENVPVDILFNNAGVLTGGLIEEQAMGDIERMLQVNVTSVIQLTKAVLPGMLERKRGKIVNNSSVAAYMHFPCASTYAASKAAIAAFTDCIRSELKDTGVTTLLLVTPGVKTRMTDEIETLYGKNFMVPQMSIPTTQYAEMIREAILHDLDILEPSGLTGVGLKIAKFLPPLFNFEVQRRFRR